MRTHWTVLACALGAALLTTSCSRPRGATVEDKRAQVRQMRDDLLLEFYKADPSLPGKVQSAVGYGAFSNTGFKFFVVGTGHGYGLVREQATGRETFMRMAQVGGGVGMGVKNFFFLFVFQDRQAMRQFIDQGWQLGGEAQAAAVARDVGVSAGTDVKGSSGGASGGGGGSVGSAAVRRTVGSGFEIYQLTRAGAALEATVSGTKFWKDRSLN